MSERISVTARFAHGSTITSLAVSDVRNTMVEQ